MRKTPKVINIFGSAGAGKTTLAMGVAYQLRLKGYATEYVSEYAKTLVFEKSIEKLKIQHYVFSKQLKNLLCAMEEDSVDYVVTDSPLLLSLFYGEKYNSTIPYLPEMILSQHNVLDNVNIFLTRSHAFDPRARLQGEEESDSDSQTLKEFLHKYSIPCLDFNTANDTAERVVEHLLKDV